MGNEMPQRLGPIAIYAMVGEAGSSRAPKIGRRLLIEFVRQADDGNVDPRLFDYIIECFAKYLQMQRSAILDSTNPRVLDGESPPKIVSLEQAFGLAIGRGQPPVDEDERTNAASSVLKARLTGKSYQTAIEEVAEARKDAGLPVHSETELRRCWKTHRVKAFMGVCIVRDETGVEWSDEERIRLRKIYQGATGFPFGAEKSVNSP